ncbi:hypothetical protein BCF33_1653 [Hasllibacter halocynthiae]|uniref:Uncharacterized protein n=1 Tax=Hasllibacter halocynthiae TaxID=595589 RepID=A0A2T0X1H4_9RHOB|nr:DciA family protein [Hasllibacter halocynthiae]PRY92799.1 hypothetical protein BCF33_1653 [Hasllibacter halocynthiae]
MARKPAPRPSAKPRARGFARASTLVEGQVKVAGDGRGFAVARLLTRWEEIVGPDLAALVRPVKVGHGKGIGAELTVHAEGPRAALAQMATGRIRDRVNACYGYRAIARVRVTQIAPAPDPGFAETRAPYMPPSQAALARGEGLAEGATDPDLRAALAALGSHVMSKGETR